VTPCCRSACRLIVKSEREFVCRSIVQHRLEQCALRRLPGLLQLVARNKIGPVPLIFVFAMLAPPMNSAICASCPQSASRVHIFAFVILHRYFLLHTAIPFLLPPARVMFGAHHHCRSSPFFITPIIAVALELVCIAEFLGHLAPAQCKFPVAITCCRLFASCPTFRMKLVSGLYKSRNQHGTPLGTIAVVCYARKRNR